MTDSDRERMSGKLVGYDWSNLPGYQRGKGPTSLVLERVLGASGWLNTGAVGGQRRQSIGSGDGRAGDMMNRAFSP